MEIKGLPCSVFISPLGDCTADGLSSKHNSLILVDESIQAPFTVKDGEDYLVLIRREIAGKPYVHAVPKSVLDSGNCAMFGGNFIYTSDSRFPNSYPIPIHDRVEHTS